MAAHPASRLDQPRCKTVIQLSECGGGASSERLSKGVGHLVPPWDVLLYGTRDHEICLAPPKTASDRSVFLAGSRGADATRASSLMATIRRKPLFCEGLRCSSPWLTGAAEVVANMGQPIAAFRTYALRARESLDVWGERRAQVRD